MGQYAELAEDELLRRAENRDQHAARELLERNLPYLFAVANRVAPNGIDPDDMVNDVILRLLKNWATGRGPQDNLRAYLAAAIRNAAVDHMRSFHGRLVQLEESAEVAADSLLEHRRAELSDEYDIVKSSFATLGEDYRLVLSEIVMYGKKPAEVAAQTGRTAPMVSSTLKRAKAALRRQVLISWLSRGSGECAHNAKKLPSKVQDVWEQHRLDERGLSHVSQCDSCKWNWSRFGGIAGMLSVTSLLLLSETVVLPVGAVAAPLAETGPRLVDNDLPQSGAQVSGSDDGVPAESQGQVDHLATIRADAGVRNGSASSMTISKTDGQSPSHKWPAVAAIFFAIVAAMMLLPLFLNGPQVYFGERYDLTGAEAHDVSYGASLTVEDGVAELNLDFEVLDEPAWQLEVVEFQLPDGVALDLAPEGWVCAAELGGIACVHPEPQPALGAFFFASADGGAELSGEFYFTVRATAPNRVEITLQGVGQL